MERVFNQLNQFNFNLIPGRHGGGPAGREDERPAGHADRVRHLHDAPRRRPHARPHDQHVHPAEHRNRVQSAQHLPRQRIAARAPPLVHRDGVGLLDAARVDSVPAGDCHPVLGQVLRPQHDRRLVRLHRPHPGAGRVCRVCVPLLPLAHDAQVRGDRVRHSGAGDAQGQSGPSASPRATVPVGADRLRTARRATL